MKQFNILFVSTIQNYFVDDQASFGRMYNTLKYFHELKDFNVIVLQPNVDKQKEKEILKLKIKTFYFNPIKIFGNTLGIFTDFNIFFILKIREIIKKYRVDIIHIDFPFGINCLRLFTKLPISYNSHNVEFIYHYDIGKYYHKIPIFFRFIYTRYIYFIERLATEFVYNINAVSRNDKIKFHEIYKTNLNKITEFKIGYNHDVLYNPKNRNLVRKKFNIDPNKFVVIYHGSYHRNEANKEAIQIINDYIAPEITEPDILFLIAGKTPPFKNKKNLKFLGFVPDLKDFLYTADIAIVPILRGSGVRTKVIDYLSANIPIISTKKGIEGLDFENNVHGYVVNNIGGILHKVRFLEKNLEYVLKFKNNIKRLIESSYNWEIIIKGLAKRYRKIIRFSKKRGIKL